MRKEKRKNNLKKEEFYKIGQMYKATIRLKKTENELEIKCLYPGMQKKVDGISKIIEELIEIEDYFLERYNEFGGFQKIQILGLKDSEEELKENLENLIEKRTSEYEEIKKYDVGEKLKESYKKAYFKSILETSVGFLLAGCGVGGFLVEPKSAYFIPYIEHVVRFLSNPIVAATLCLTSIPIIIFCMRNTYRNLSNYAKSNEAPRKKGELKKALLFKETMDIV